MQAQENTSRRAAIGAILGGLIAAPGMCTSSRLLVYVEKRETSLFFLYPGGARSYFPPSVMALLSVFDSCQLDDFICLTLAVDETNHMSSH